MSQELIDLLHTSSSNVGHSNPTVVGYVTDANWYSLVDQVILANHKPEIFSALDNDLNGMVAKGGAPSKGGLGLHATIYQKIIYCKIVNHWASIRMNETDHLLSENGLIRLCDSEEADRDYNELFWKTLHLAKVFRTRL